MGGPFRLTSQQLNTETLMESLWNALTELGPFAWPFLAGAVYFVCQAAVRIARTWANHAERMAMIERGMHPDARQASEPATETSTSQEPADLTDDPDTRAHAGATATR